MLNEYKEVALTIHQSLLYALLQYHYDPQNLYLVYNAVYKLMQTHWSSGQECKYNDNPYFI